MSRDNDTPFEVQSRRQPGHFEIDNVLLDVYGKKLGPYGIAVYAALSRFANRDSECWPSLSTIGERTGMSRRQVIRMVAKLVELEIITITPRYNEKGEQVSSLYVLLEIVKRGDSQSPPPVTHSHPGSDSQSPKQSPKNKHTQKSKNKDQDRSFRPPPDIDPLGR